MKRKIVSILILIQLALLILTNRSFAVNNAVAVGTENFGGMDNLELLTTTEIITEAGNRYEEMGYYGTRKLIDPSYLTLCRKFECKGAIILYTWKC